MKHFQQFAKRSGGSLLLTIGLGAAVAGGIGGTASAQGYTRAHGSYGQPGYVVADSRYGKGSVSGAVREGHRGVMQVQMPGGTWIDCVRSCSETLRRATVDFWESNGPQAKDTGPGYFSWSFGRW